MNSFKLIKHRWILNFLRQNHKFFCLKLLIFIFFQILALSSSLYAEDAAMQKLNEILQKKKQSSQPFDEKDLKIDLESLGLDNVDKKPTPANQNSAIKTDPKSAINPSQIPSNKNSQANSTLNLQEKALDTKDKNNKNEEKSIGTKISDALKQDKLDKARIENEKTVQNSKIKAAQEIDESVVNSTNSKAKTKTLDQEVVVKTKKPGCVVKKDMAQIDFSLPKKAQKKPIKKFRKTSKKIVKSIKSRGQKFVKTKVKTRNEKGEEVIDEIDLTEKEIELQKKSKEIESLQWFYSQESLEESEKRVVDDDFAAEVKIKPRRKELNNFTLEELPPIPILNRARSYDNMHIPFILTPKEKIDIMFSAISMGSVTFFNEAYKYVQNPNIYNDQGDTILTYSLLIKRLPVAAAALAKGADPNLPNKLGHTPLGIAIEMIDFKALELLADNNADLKYIDAFGRTYLMHAARVGFLPAVDLLVKRGVDVNAKDEDGFTALSIAYRHRKELIVQYLLKNGAKTWEEKEFTPNQNLIFELENRWR